MDDAVEARRVQEEVTALLVKENAHLEAAVAKLKTKVASYAKALDQRVVSSREHKNALAEKEALVKQVPCP